MKKLIIIITLIILSNTLVSASGYMVVDYINAIYYPVEYAITDIKENSKIKVESTIPATAIDWKTGDWFVGNALPFAQIGSFIYFNGAYFKKIDSIKPSCVSLGAGLNLNPVTRPVLKMVFNNIPYLKSNAPIIDAAANALSIGINAGHDFSYIGKKDLIFNRIVMYFGAEIAFGKPKGDVTTSDSSNHWFLK